MDIRDAMRALARTPGVTLTAVALIALVIGGNTTVFSIIHGILTKPAPGVRATGLVTVDLWVDGRGYNGGNSYPNYVDYARQSTTVDPLAAMDVERFTLATENGSYALRGGAVTPNFFDALGVHPIVGRIFAEGESGPDAAGLTAVISERAWRRYFQGAADIAGRSITLNGHPATIVGVAPPRFEGPVLGESADVWVPLLTYSHLHQTESVLNDRGALRGLFIIGRLAPGVALARAQAEFAAVSRRLQSAYPATNRTQLAIPIPYAAIATGSLLGRQGSMFLALFSIITLLTVLIVCANVANLMLARAVARQRELAVRQSLGASRARIVRMLVVEGVAVSLTAGAAACAFALSMSKVLAAVIPPDPSGNIINADIAPDWQVLAYAMALAAIGTVAFTTAPALRAWRQQVLPWLKAGEHSVVQGRSRLSSALVVMQLAFSVLLLTSAGLAYRSLSLMSSTDLGFNTSRVLLVGVNTAGSAATRETNVAVLDRLRERLLTVPGVEAVSYVRFTGGWRGEAVRLPGEDARARAELNWVGPDYLRVLGLTPLAGQEFTDRDGIRANTTAIINQHLAETLWPGQRAVGQTLLIGSDRQVVAVAGVAPNAFFNGFRRDAHPDFIFLSEHQAPADPGETTFYIRYAGGPGGPGSIDRLTPAIGRALGDADARVPIVAMRTLDRELASARWPVEFITVLLILFAVGSLAIAAVGQYAVVAFNMRRRTRDFGLRMALGASARQILGSIVSEGLQLTTVGLLIGFSLSLAAGHGLRGVLYGVTPTDERTYLGVFTLLAAASLLACCLPARRAARIDPMVALRDE